MSFEKPTDRFSTLFNSLILLTKNNTDNICTNTILQLHLYFNQSCVLTQSTQKKKTYCYHIQGYTNIYRNLIRNSKIFTTSIHITTYTYIFPSFEDMVFGA